MSNHLLRRSLSLRDRTSNHRSPQLITATTSVKRVLQSASASSTKTARQTRAQKHKKAAKRIRCSSRSIWSTNATSACVDCTCFFLRKTLSEPSECLSRQTRRRLPRKRMLAQRKALMMMSLTSSSRLLKRVTSSSMNSKTAFARKSKTLR
jgi:hypothetical protein